MEIAYNYSLNYPSGLLVSALQNSALKREQKTHLLSTLYTVCDYPKPFHSTFMPTQSLPFGVAAVGVAASDVTGVIFDFECDNSSFACTVCFIRRLWRVVKPPVSKSRSSRWPERDRVNWRWTYSSKSSSSRLLIKQFNISKNMPRITANKPVATNSFHHDVGLAAMYGVFKGKYEKDFNAKKLRLHSACSSQQTIFRKSEQHAKCLLLTRPVNTGYVIRQ